MFKLQKTLDCHNARQNLNNCALPHPPYFALSSTFKIEILSESHANFGVNIFCALKQQPMKLDTEKNNK
jgi:hypothetical protein